MADDPTTGAPTPAGADPYIHPFPTNAQGQLVNPDAVKKEGQRIRDAQKAEQAKKEAADKIWQTLRDAKPSFLKDGFGLRGPLVPEIRRTTDFSQGSVTREALKPAFPPADATQEVTQVAGTSVPQITFICSDTSRNVGDPGVFNYIVLVADGEVNGVLPDGMGGDDFELTLADPTDAYIYVLVTFNPTTLEITSATVAASNVDDIPESRVESDTSGFLVYILAEAFLDGDGDFQVINRRVGDINFELVYGSQNGQPALLPVTTEAGGWLDLAFLP